VKGSYANVILRVREASARAANHFNVVPTPLDVRAIALIFEECSRFHCDLKIGVRFESLANRIPDRVVPRVRRLRDNFHAGFLVS
jgi:hypothetical protein